MEAIATNSIAWQRTSVCPCATCTAAWQPSRWQPLGAVRSAAPACLLQRAGEHGIFWVAQPVAATHLPVAAGDSIGCLPASATRLQPAEISADMELAWRMAPR